MKQSIRFIVLLFLCPLLSLAQADSTNRAHLRISLLTVGVGDEIYASFGHTGIRITDSVRGTDIVYNWGTFDGFQDNFELKFTQGKLLYYCSSETFQHFVQTYIYERRGIQEQVLNLSEEQKLRLQAIVLDNLKEENRYYKYDFLYDNCATRPRDILKSALGNSFQFGPALNDGRHNLTFRDLTNEYLRFLPWERFGINLLLGSPVDRIMSNEQAMFLPDKLRNGLKDASLSGQKVAGPAEEVLPAQPEQPVPANTPLFVMLAFSAFVIIGSAIPGIKPLATLAGHLMAIVTGVLGCLMLFIWLGTDHQACRNNFNILWCLPTNIIISFVKREKRGRYALVAIALIVGAVALHVFGIQALPMGVIWPLLLALTAFFGMIYRAASAPESDESDAHHHH